jgi:AraC-like DNA-binding protein
LLAEYRHPQPHSDIAARAALHSLLIDTLRDHDRRRANAVSPEIQRALDWIDAHLSEDFALDALADVAGLSKGHFSARFAEETGFAPHEYRMRRRVRLAKYYLHDPERSITDIAFRLGFSTSQYFATVFKKLAGIAPSAYREMALARRE